MYITTPLRTRTTSLKTDRPRIPCDAACSWATAKRVRDSLKGLLDRPLGHPAELADAHDAALGVGFVKDQLRSVLARLPVDDGVLVLGAEPECEGQHAGVVGEPAYVDDVYRVVIGVARRGELALELLDVVRERGFEAVRGVLLERVDSTWYLCPSRASAESSGYSGTCPLSILNR